MFFYGWGTEYFTQLQYRYFDLSNSHHLGQLRPFFELSGLARQAGALDGLGIGFLIVPVEGSTQALWNDLRQELRSEFLLHTYSLLFEEIPLVTSSQGWQLLKRREHPVFETGRSVSMDTRKGASAAANEEYLTTYSGCGGVVADRGAGVVLDSTTQGYAYIAAPIRRAGPLGMTTVSVSFSLEPGTSGFMLRLTSSDGAEIASVELSEGSGQIRTSGGIRDVDLAFSNELLLRYSWAETVSHLEIDLNGATSFQDLGPERLAQVALGDLQLDSGRGTMNCQHVSVDWTSCTTGPLGD
jgi:hypothetical protein